MPTPIVHLCVAKELIEALGVQDRPGFYLGSIAPDAMYLAPTYYDTDGYYERYRAAHLLRGDFTQWRAAVRAFAQEHNAGEQREFYLGYGVHILTDIRWKEMVLPAFERAYTDVSGEERRAIYYRDAAQFDIECYEKCRLRSGVWPCLADAAPFDAGELVRAHEMKSWKENTLQLFDHEEGRKNRRAEYFSHDRILGFIMDTATNIQEDYPCTLTRN